MPDPIELIDHPPHYTATPIEPIEVIEAWGLGFHLGNAVKYIARAKHKGSEVQDIKKAMWYLDRWLTQWGQHENVRTSESVPISPLQQKVSEILSERGFPGYERK
jgi:hypothetical protein